MFKGRFGDFYLLKVWALTVFVGPILSTFLSFFFNKGEKLNEELFVSATSSLSVGKFVHAHVKGKFESVKEV